MEQAQASDTTVERVCSFDVNGVQHVAEVVRTRDGVFMRVSVQYHPLPGRGIAQVIEREPSIFFEPKRP